MRIIENLCIVTDGNSEHLFQIHAKNWELWQKLIQHKGTRGSNTKTNST